MSNLTKVGVEKQKDPGNQLVAFRADANDLKIIWRLEKITGKNKTEILKEALHDSSGILLMKETLQKITPVVRDEFHGSKISHVGIGSKKEDDSEFNLSPQSSFIVFDLPEYEGYHRRNCDYFNHSHLHQLFIELKVEGLETMRVMIKKPLLITDIQRTAASITKEFQVIALKNNLEYRSSEKASWNNKKLMGFEFYIERRFNLQENWIESFTKNIKSLHNALQKIKEISCFKKGEK